MRPQATAVSNARQPVEQRQERQVAGDGGDRAKATEAKARRDQQAPARVRGARQPSRAAED